MHIIKTNRLLLRPICKEDRDAMVNTVMSDMTVMKWLPGAKDTVTPGGQKAVASAYLKDFTTPWKTHGFGIWALCIKDPTLGTPGTFIGYCGFLPEQIQDAGPEGEAVFPVSVTAWIRLNSGLVKIQSRQAARASVTRPFPHMAFPSA